jgi:glucose/arabinose dehydrogenase
MGFGPLGNLSGALVWGLTLAYLALEPARATAGTVSSCAGDCADDGEVSIADLIMSVNIALGNQPVSNCHATDVSGDGTVTVNELIRAVGAALEGCPPVPTATGSAGDTPTVPAVDTPTSTVPIPTETALSTETPAPTATSMSAGTPSPTPTAIPTSATKFCDLPGSVQFTGPGISVVPGSAAGASNLSFLELPVGFCAHYFGKVRNARQLRFAPGGELFVASPTKFTTSNGAQGRQAIVVLADDDADGEADDPPTTFLGNLPATVGMLFANGSFYYQNDTRIMRVPYTPGDRTAAGVSEEVANITVYTSFLHWPKSLDIDDSGTIYVSNGGDEGEPCDPRRPFRGGILKLDGTPGGAEVARGLRNPISLRCARGHNMCFAVELARDYSTDFGGREKLVPIRDGDDWGFSCCASRNLPYSDLRPQPDCSQIATEIDAFVIGHTPFDLDFEPGRWPEPWKHHVFVPLHGAYGTWEGASLVAIDFDAMTGTVLPGSNLGNIFQGAMSEFATGWGAQPNGRPTAVAFAPDGRLFLANDNNGDIIWIAPLDL